ncbi:hypothetical protein MMC12_007766, partial [Toensbergia leucococca]|nr:hypothetical protein [Toensbergia leucococca]
MFSSVPFLDTLKSISRAICTFLYQFLLVRLAVYACNVPVGTIKAMHPGLRIVLALSAYYLSRIPVYYLHLWKHYCHGFQNGLFIPGLTHDCRHLNFLARHRGSHSFTQVERLRYSSCLGEMNGVAYQPILETSMLRMKYFAVKFVCVVFVAAILIISTSISWTSSNNSTEEDSIKEVREVSEDEKQQVALESSEPITMDNEVLHDLEDQLFTQRCLTEEAVQALHKAQQKAKRETRDWKLWAQAKEKRHLKEVESLREGQLALENQKLAAEQVKAKERASKAEVAVLQLRTERNEEKERAARFEKDAKEKGRQVESLGKLLEDESMQANIVGVKYNEAEASLKYQNSVLKAKLDGAVETERQGRATIDTLRGKFQQQRVDMEDMYTINLQRATATLRSENEGLRQESLSKTAQIDQLTAEINRITVHARVNAENSVAEMAAEKVRNLEEQLRKQAGTITELEESLSELQYARQQAENRFAGAQDQLAQLQLAQLNRPVNQKARLKEVAKRLEKEKSEREEVRSWEVGRDAENVQLKFEVDQFKQGILRLPTENFNLESQNESLVTSVRAYEELHGGANAGEGKIKVSRRRDEDEDEEEAAKPRQLQRLEAKPAMAAPSTT